MVAVGRVTFLHVRASSSGVDISKDAIAAAKKYFCSDMRNLGFRSGDFEKLSSRLTDFNVALFIDSLHHADNQLTALKSAHKALKSGGICIICEPGKGHSKAPDAIRAKQDVRSKRKRCGAKRNC